MEENFRLELLSMIDLLPNKLRETLGLESVRVASFGVK